VSSGRQAPPESVLNRVILPQWISIIIDILFDRLLSFSKLSEYRCCIRFRQYRIDFVLKKYENKNNLTSYQSFRFHPSAKPRQGSSPSPVRPSVQSGCIQLLLACCRCSLGAQEDQTGRKEVWDLFSSLFLP
jgi:hypothetical protein